MPAAMTALATITLGSAQATVTFGSIPATYRDLRLVVNAYGPGGDNSYCRFNSDSGANYPQVYMYGNGSSAASSSSTWSEQYLGTLGTAMTTNTLDILDYAQTDKHKSTLVRGNDTTAYVQARAGRWANTAAITSITITCGGTYSTGSVFSLYGILA
jgi:hypothetical protein